MIIPEMNKRKVKKTVKWHDFPEIIITFGELIPKKTSYPLWEFPPVPPIPPVPQAWWWNKRKTSAVGSLLYLRPSIFIYIANWQALIR